MSSFVAISLQHMEAGQAFSTNQITSDNGPIHNLYRFEFWPNFILVIRIIQCNFISVQILTLLKKVLAKITKLEVFIYVWYFNL